MAEPARPAIRALIFDMDGLLVDSEPFAEAAMADFLRRHGHELSGEVSIKLLGRRVPEAIAMVVDHYRIAGKRDELAAIYDDIRLAAIRGNLRPMPGAAEIIQYGRDAGLALGLATSNLRSHVDLSLTETALAGLFDAEVTGDEVERGKPEPDIFLLAASRLGVDPAMCVVFEDSAAGVTAGKAAGMRVVWVPDARSNGVVPAREPDLIAPDLMAAIPWLVSSGAPPARSTLQFS